MIRKLILICISIIGVSLSAYSGGTFYSKITVKTSNEARGKVYVSTSSEMDGEYSDISIKENSQSESSGNSGDHKYYLYAEPAEGLELDYWEDENKKRIDNNDFYIITATSDDKNKPTEATLTAYFKERTTAVFVKTSNPFYGTATIDNPNNKIGDKVTVTAKKYFPPNMTYSGSTGTSNSIKFAGWYDSDGNLKSTNLIYTFTANELVDLTATFVWDKPITNADGFYRVRYFNQAEDYMSIIGSYSTNFKKNGNTKDVIELTPNYNQRYSDPGTIIRIKGEPTTYQDFEIYETEKEILSGVDLSGQGASSKAASTENITFTIKTTSVAGFYKFTYGGLNLRLFNHNHERGWEKSHDYKYYEITTGAAGQPKDVMSYFDLEPVDINHVDEYYFGVAPAAEMRDEDGYYWSTLYTAFPYECYEEDGVEAYYISRFVEGNGETIAVLTPIHDNIVPAETPVILKCKSTNVKENRLIPITDDVKALEDNLLQGEYQIPDMESGWQPKTFTDNMRVLSTNGSTIGFYKLESGTVLEGNRSWLDISTLSDTQAKKIVIRMDDGNISVVEGISVNQDEDENAPIYNLQGVIVRNPIPGQIYIRNGKKFVAR